MTVSVFDMFSVGVGPSSSHTVGPMRAAAAFTQNLTAAGKLHAVESVRVELFGSLAATGHGHGTLTAIAIGLEGNYPEVIEPDAIESTVTRIDRSGKLNLGGAHNIAFGLDGIILRPLTILPRHTNGMRLTAYRGDEALLEETYFSIGGGFVTREGDDAEHGESLATRVEPHPFSSGRQLLDRCAETGGPISAVMLSNELVARSEAEIRSGLLHIHTVMEESVARSIRRDGLLPGGLSVRRRAKAWHDSLVQEDSSQGGSSQDGSFQDGVGRDPHFAMDWVNLVALAVNEENASGGRVVTAPTNGAAGIIPAVLHYALNYLPHIVTGGRPARDDAIVRFLLTAGAIGTIYKERASISGAEVGCQGEVGSASSMAAAGLAELLGGNPEQVENAAEIAMEHNLGLTCDPIGGLVQIPCIERNAIASNKAINAARMALRGDGEHHVSLDQVIETMRQTGADMSTKYKETAMGGLAVNVPVC
jgi:L-serine dehydratase